jgi:flavin-dependent dehydrogenase
MCAARVSELGSNVTLIELEKTPGEEVCAEGVPLDVLNVCDVKPFVENEIRSMYIYHWNKLILSVDFGRCEGYIINRHKLDGQLAQDAEKHGAKVITECKAKSVQGNTVKTDKGDYSGKYLVFSDGGSHSLARNFFDYSNFQSVPSMQYRMDNLKLDNPNGLYFYLYDDIGYVWIFPMSEEVANVGAGFETPSLIKPTLNQLLKDPILKNGRIARTQGAVIPFNGVLSNFVSGNYLVAGDAASQVLPLIGEGNRFALASGKYAAEALAKDDLQTYPRLFSSYSKLIKRFYYLLEFMRDASIPERRKLIQTLADPTMMKVAEGSIPHALKIALAPGTWRCIGPVVASRILLLCTRMAAI